MVESKSVDLKISASKKVLKRALKKESKKNVLQDKEISKLKNSVVKLKKKKSSVRVSEYNLFIRKHIRAGRSFIGAVKEWNKFKALQKKSPRRVSAYNQFIGSQMRIGKTFVQSVALWKLARAGKLGRKGKTRTITKTITRTKVVPSKSVLAPAQSFSSAQVKNIFSQGASSRVSGGSLGSDDDEVALKLMHTYFSEVVRYGFKRRLSLDQVIDAYFYVLSKVKSGGKVSFSDIDNSIKGKE